MLMQTAKHQAATGTGNTSFPGNLLPNSHTANVRNFHSTNLIGMTQSAPTHIGRPSVGAKRWKAYTSVKAESASIAYTASSRSQLPAPRFFQAPIPIALCCNTLARGRKVIRREKSIERMPYSLESLEALPLRTRHVQSQQC